MARGECTLNLCLRMFRDLRHDVHFYLMRSIERPMNKMKISVFVKFTYFGISEIFFLGGGGLICSRINTLLITILL